MRNLKAKVFILYWYAGLGAPRVNAVPIYFWPTDLILSAKRVLSKTFPAMNTDYTYTFTGN